jgi:hypothetical protein
MSRGYVYVLVNRAMPGLVKIGFSTKSPSERASELSTTGVPHPFEVCYYCETEEPSAYEAEIHRVLMSRRVSESREFFKVSVGAAVTAIRNIIQPFIEWESQTGYATDNPKSQSAPYDLSPESVNSNPAYLERASKSYGRGVSTARPTKTEDPWRVRASAGPGLIASMKCPYCRTEFTTPLSREAGLVPPRVVTCNHCRRTIIT